MTATQIGIVCGSGALPFAVAESVERRGIKAFLLPIRGFADDAHTGRYPHQWIGLGQYGLMKKALRAAGIRDVTFIGGLVRPSLRSIGFDFGTLRALPRLLKGFRGGDDHLLTTIANIIESDGFRVVGLDSVAPELLVPVGALGRRVPDAKAEADIARALAALHAMGPFDIGQGAVVIGGHIVALEGIEGTDELLARVKHLREIGRLRAPPGLGVLVKAPKHGQDTRFDLPSLGPRTVEGVVAAGLAGVAVVAGFSVVAEADKLVELADRHDVFVTGLPDAGPEASAP
jgi:DUF1009 family protein